MKSRIAGDKPNTQRQEYTARINRVLDYIESHLDQELTLDELARVANFSRFHFHRIFKAMVGETLNRFVARLRVEKAAVQLLNNPNKSITEIALDCGFSGSAVFSRTFKDAFGVSPSEWRQRSDPDAHAPDRQNSKIGQTVGNPGQDIESVRFYIDDQTYYPTWRIVMKNQLESKIEVKEMPEMTVAYVRHIGPYQGNEKLFEGLFTKLMGWAAPRGLIRFPETQMLAVYHDDPDLTEGDNLRVSCCISVPPDTDVSGEIGKMVVPGGMFAVGHFEITADQYEDAWGGVMGGWLPDNGFEPDDRLCYELYHNDPNQHPEHHHIVDICVPVKPL